eukprot:Skav202314  [mRNA]  locus=scaffold60:205030:207925:+ [translate_table: standard]
MVTRKPQSVAQAGAMTRFLPNPWHKEAPRRMVIDEEDGCYIPIQTPESKNFKLVPKNELKPEQFPKAVIEALRREGAPVPAMPCRPPFLPRRHGHVTRGPFQPLLMALLGLSQRRWRSTAYGKRQDRSELLKLADELKRICWGWGVLICSCCKSNRQTGRMPVHARSEKVLLLMKSWWAYFMMIGAVLFLSSFGIFEGAVFLSEEERKHELLTITLNCC